MDKVQSRRRIAQVLAVLVALALVLLGVVGTGVSSFADERSDAVKNRDAQTNRISDLRDDLAGIDAEIAEVIIAVEETAAAVEVAEANLAAAESDLAAAERHLEQVETELEGARAELNALDEQIDEFSETEEDLSGAVGDMARDLYRGGSTSPIEVVMKTEDLQDVTARSAAATSLSRVQSQALNEVRTGLVVKENHAVRQEAVIERVEQLKEEAVSAKAEAEEARNAVQQNLGALEASLAEQSAAQAKWESQKETALAQLNSAQVEKEQADAVIARIDKENREKQRVFEEEQQRLAAEQANQAQNQPSTAPSQNNSSGSTSQPSAPKPAPAPAPAPKPAPAPPAAAAPSSGALFASPFRFPLRVTSSFGYRVHPILGYTLFHSGTDFGAACGTSQYAVRSGVVAQTGYNSGLGYFVRVNHGMINGSSYVTEHGHLSQILVSTGQQVNTGTVLGLTGTTGRSTGCHLHLGLLRNGSYDNVMSYM